MISTPKRHPWAPRSLQRRMVLAVSLPFLAVVVLTSATFFLRMEARDTQESSIGALENQLALEQLLTTSHEAHLAAIHYARTQEGDRLARFDRALAREAEALDDVVDNLSHRAARDIREAVEDHRRALQELVAADLAVGERRRLEGVAATNELRLAAVERRISREEDARFRAAREEADTLSNRVTVGGVLIGLVGAVGGLIVVGFLSRGVAGRLRRLQLNAQRLGTDEPLLPEGGGGEEIVELATAMETAHATIREKDDQLDLALEAGGMVIFDVDPDERVTLRGEPALLRTIGFEGSRAVTTLADVRERLGIDAAGSISRLPSGDWQVRTPDGGTRWFEVRSRERPPVGEEGARVVGVLSDVTARVEAQGALLLAKDQAEQASRSKDEFLSRMSHELRTPLNAVLGFAQLLEMEDLDPEQRECVEHILKGGRHLLALVNDVLDLARIESGRLSLSVEPTRLVDVVDEAIHLTLPLARQHEVELSVSREHGDVHALVDRRRMKQVLINLLTNGVKYNRPRGRVTVRWSAADGRVRVLVADTGIGIDDRQRTDLFLPFARSDARTIDIEGTGLGLAVSRSLVEAMGGTLTLSETEDTGSTFAIDVPVAEGQAAEIAGDHPTDGALEQLRALAPLSVLHVEDNAANRRLVEELLRRAGNPPPVTAVDGRQGLELARHHVPDLVLLDRHLPDMLGEEVLRELRADDRTAGIPVIVVSADTMEHSVSIFRRSGADAFLAKPIEAEGLWRTVSSVMREREGTR